MQLPEHLKIAVDNYLAGTASKEEEEQVNDWFYSFHDKVVEVVAPVTDMREWLEQNMREKILASILQPGRNTAKPAVHRLRRIHYWRWAAASILLIGLGAYLWRSGTDKPVPAAGIPGNHDITAGSNGAILTLADGSQVILDSVQNGTVALQAGVIARMVNNELLYEGTGKESVYNTMTTPRGRQFQVTLPDGTKVWLNAASSIRYPTVFVGKERKVEVAGEVYFEVAKNKNQPFKVSIADHTNIEVLGTHFNVNAYDNEETIHTTLLEGSIKTNGAMLKPGQQAVIAGDSLRIHSVNTDNIMAWKNGFFDFNGLTFKEVMRQLERWYDIKVLYENNKPYNKRLAGGMTRTVSLNTLIKYLESIGVHCQLNGRTLHILP